MKLCAIRFEPGTLIVPKAILTIQYYDYKTDCYFVRTSDNVTKQIARTKLEKYYEQIE